MWEAHRERGCFPFGAAAFSQNAAGAANRGFIDDLHVQIDGGFGVFLNKGAAGLHPIAHHGGEGLVGQRGVGHIHPDQDALFRVHGGLPQFVGVHLAEALVALDIDLGVSIAAPQLLADGVSLTVSALGNDWIGVDLIPTTAKETTLGAKQVGDEVNLEGDIVGKYIAKEAERPPLTEEALRRAGFIA